MLHLIWKYKIEIISALLSIGLILISFLGEYAPSSPEVSVNNHDGGNVSMGGGNVIVTDDCPGPGCPADN